MTTIEITDVDRELVSHSLSMFDSYAANGSDVDPEIYNNAIRTMQVKHARWQAAKLSGLADTSLSVMNLGIVEEACWELPMAIEQENPDEIYDTLGDIMIYTCATCTQLRLDFCELARGFDPSYLERPDDGVIAVIHLYKAIGMLAHVVGKAAQRTRGYDDIKLVRDHGGTAIARICKTIHWLCFSNDWDASVLFQDVLTKVMSRDWVKNKITGEADATA